MSLVGFSPSKWLRGGSLSPQRLLGVIANYSSHPHNRLDCSNESSTRERNQTVISYYNQSAVDVAATKVRLLKLKCIFIVMLNVSCTVKNIVFYL